VLGGIAMTQATIQKSATDGSTWAWLRYQAVAWFGIAGAAATLMSHLLGVIEFARAFKLLASVWTAAITAVWRKALFFAPTISAYDAILLSLFSFLVMNSVNASFRPRPRLAYAPLLIAVPALAFVPIFVARAQVINDDRPGLIQIYAESPLGQALSSSFNWLLDFVGPMSLLGLVAGFGFFFFSFFFIPLVAAVIAIAALDYAFGVRFNFAAFTVRIWKIFFCFAVLLGLNYLALWWEHGLSTPPPFLNPQLGW
jgi:hypothetical protein